MLPIICIAPVLRLEHAIQEKRVNRVPVRNKDALRQRLVTLPEFQHSVVYDVIDQ